MFNMSSVEYNSMLSQPGALEALDKDYGSMQKKAGGSLGQDFQSIRAGQKLSTDISLMSPFKTVKKGEASADEGTGRMSYNQQSKACIP